MGCLIIVDIFKYNIDSKNRMLYTADIGVSGLLFANFPIFSYLKKIKLAFPHINNI